MSRRDTILIAVLVNAALLIVLFVTAIRSGKDEIPSGETTQLQLAERPIETPQTQEEFLNQYITPMPTLAEKTLQRPGSSFEILPVEEIPLTFPIPERTPSEVEIASSSPPLKQAVKEESVSLATVNVTVKKGDFLEKIAKANGTTVAAIMKENNLASTQLKIGQVLKIPLSGEKKTVEKAITRTASSVPAASETEFYVVKEGDNPWLIASRNHLKLEELLRLNQLDEQKAKKLRPGDKLRIR